MCCPVAWAVSMIAAENHTISCKLHKWKYENDVSQCTEVTAHRGQLHIPCCHLWVLPGWSLLTVSPLCYKNPEGFSYLPYVKAADQLNQWLLDWSSLSDCSAGREGEFLTGLSTSIILPPRGCETPEAKPSFPWHSCTEKLKGEGAGCLPVTEAHWHTSALAEWTVL